MILSTVAGVDLVEREVSCLRLHRFCLFRQHEIKRTSIKFFNEGSVIYYCPVGRIVKVGGRKKLNNFGGTGMKEKEKRDTVIFSRVGVTNGGIFFIVGA